MSEPKFKPGDRVLTRPHGIMRSPDQPGSVVAVLRRGLYLVQTDHDGIRADFSRDDLILIPPGHRHEDSEPCA